MKGKNLFITLGLALGLGFGVAAGLSAGKEVKEVSATGPLFTGDTIYLQANNTWHGSVSETVGLYMHCWSTSSDATDVKFTNLSGKLYYASLPAAYDNVIFYRSDDPTDTNRWWNQSADITFSTLFTGGNNAVIQWDDSGDSGWNFDKYHAAEYRADLANKVYLRGTWSNGWADLSKEMTLVSGDVYKIENVLLSENDELKAMKVGADHWVSYKDATGISGNSGAEVSGLNIKIKATGNYTVTADMSTGAYTVDVYEDVDLTKAVAFADDFETEMGKYCPVTGSVEGRVQKDFTDAWESFATRFTEDESETTRGYLKTLDNSTLNEFRERYASIMNDYSSLLSGYNFLEISLSSSNIRTSVFANETNNTLIVVVAVSAIAAASLILFVSLKKKRHN